MQLILHHVVLELALQNTSQLRVILICAVQAKCLCSCAFLEILNVVLDWLIFINTSVAFLKFGLLDLKHAFEGQLLP